MLELAYARQFVEEMPNGLDTEVGERGTENFWRPTATTGNRSSVLKRSKGLDVG